MANDIGNKTILTAAITLKALKDAADKKKEEVKQLNKDIETAEASLVEMMVEDDIPNFTHAGYTFFINTKTRASVPADTLSTFIRRVRARKFGGIVKTTILPQTLSAFVREQTDNNGGVIPKWIETHVNLFTQNSIGIRKK